ncbi:sugar transferase [Actinomadura sp. 3N508]|uniref:sugar transferase n=1 Tax=Actinomadura sp. 3N508 TaxID=3375153 RepID=UPI0037ADBA75
MCWGWPRIGSCFDLSMSIIGVPFAGRHFGLDLLFKIGVGAVKSGDPRWEALRCWVVVARDGPARSPPGEFLSVKGRAMRAQGLSPSIDSEAPADLISADGPALLAPAVPYRRGITGARVLGVLYPVCLAVVDGWAMAVAVVLVSPGAGVGLTGVAAVMVVAFNGWGGLYRARRTPSLLADMPLVVWRVAGVGAFVVLVGGGGAAAWLWVSVVGGVAALGARGVAYFAIRTYRCQRSRGRSALIVGTGGMAAHLTRILRERAELGLAAVGQVAAGIPVAEEGSGGRSVVPVLGETVDLPSLVERHGIDTLVVIAEDVHPNHLGTVLRISFGLPCETLLVQPPSDVVPVAATRRERLAGLPCARVDWRLRGPSARFAKRVLDLVAGSLILCAALPVIAVCAVAVRLEGGPGVVFRQRRIGLGGEEFVLLKFRTLRKVDERESDTRWTVRDDDRIGRVGRFLRATSLDELPQLWNVIRGDMSLVGPRPERPHFVEQFSRSCPGYMLRHRVPAGMTGWAQIHGFRGDTSIELRARLDNHYIDHWSFSGDLKILLLTVRAMIFRGAG